MLRGTRSRVPPLVTWREINAGAHVVSRLPDSGSGIVLARSRAFWLKVLCSCQTPDPQLCSPAPSAPASPASALLSLPPAYSHLFGIWECAFVLLTGRVWSRAAPTRDPRSCSDFWAGMAGRRQLGSSQAPGPHLTLKTGPQGAQVLKCSWWPGLGLAGWCVPPPRSPQQHPLCGRLGRGGSIYTVEVRTQSSARAGEPAVGTSQPAQPASPKSKSASSGARAARDGAVQTSGWRRASSPGSTCGRDEEAWGPLTLLHPRSPSPELPDFVAVCACQLSLFFAEDRGSCSETRISEL